ncbi:MAG: AAC(3)-I family aminoglycoside N-acetyltransferase [Rhizobiales bacterium]|nr:AAC(3)-I family aminoglycoside N-acetyltransferase [Hyphomicrobiales bacterium]
MPGPVSFTIERMDARQVERMHELLDLFARAFEDPEHYSSARPSREYFVRLLEDDGFFALHARKEGETIGGLVAYELRKFEQERSEVYIYDLAVDEAHRRQGVATGLIEALKPLAAARGAHVIYVQADYVDPPAIALYTKLGVREDVLHFDIPVI